MKKFTDIFIVFKETSDKLKISTKFKYYFDD